MRGRPHTDARGSMSKVRARTEQSRGVSPISLVTALTGTLSTFGAPVTGHRKGTVLFSQVEL